MRSVSPRRSRPIPATSPAHYPSTTRNGPVYGRSLVRFGRRLGTHVETPGRSAEDRAFGDYLRQPENIIQAISIPPPCSPLKVFREGAY